MTVPELRQECAHDGSAAVTCCGTNSPITRPSSRRHIIGEIGEFLIFYVLFITKCMKTSVFSHFLCKFAAKRLLVAVWQPAK